MINFASNKDKHSYKLRRVIFIVNIQMDWWFSTIYELCNTDYSKKLKGNNEENYWDLEKYTNNVILRINQWRIMQGWLYILTGIFANPFILM